MKFSENQMAGLQALLDHAISNYGMHPYRNQKSSVAANIDAISDLAIRS